MPTKQQYPIRIDISGAQGKPAAAPPAAPAGAYGAGTRTRDVASSIARVVPKALIPAAGPAGEGISNFLSVLGSQEGRVGIRDFIDGLIGNPKGGVKSDPKTFRSSAPIEDIPAAQLPPAAATGPQDTVTPYDRQLAFLDTAFRGPLTMREAAAYSNMLPARDIKTPSQKDTVLGETAKMSTAIYQNAIDQATKLAETDPEGARAAVAKATTEHFARQAGLVGFNPVQLAQAQLMNGDGEN